MSSITGLISGGGGGTPINGTATFAKDTNLFTDDQGQVWLKGFLTEGFATYPDAEVKSGNVCLMRYDNKTFSVSAQDNSPNGIYFKPDGSAFFLVGGINGQVYAYSMSTPFDISTASYVTAHTVSAQGTPVGLFFKPDGTKMYTSSGTNVNEYNLSTIWNINTAVYETQINVGINATNALTFSADGTKMFIANVSSVQDFYTYDLSTAWNISTAQPQGSQFKRVSLRYKLDAMFNIDTAVNASYVNFNSSGTMAYVSNVQTLSIHLFKLGMPYNLNTMVDTGQTFYTGDNNSNPRGRFITPDTKYFYSVFANDRTVRQFSIPDAIGFYSRNPNEYVRIK